jgi:hypothetical protein
MRLRIQGLFYFLRVAREAKQRGLWPMLRETLLRFRSWSGDGDIVITPDSVDSMSFNYMEAIPENRPGHNSKWRRAGMSGWVIFHPGRGQVDRSFSVELNPKDEPHWSIHT